MINEKINLSVEIIDNIQMGALHRSEILVNDMKTGLYPVKLNDGNIINIFIIPEEGKKFDNNILICKLDDNKCFILYRIKIDRGELIEYEFVKQNYIKEIVNDKENGIGTVFLSILNIRKKVIKQYLNLPYDLNIIYDTFEGEK